MSCLIDQISIFVENRPGKLAAIAEVMEAQMINFLAFSIAEADGFGLVRAVVDDPQSAQKVMRELGYAVIVNKVVAVQMKDQPAASKRSPTVWVPSASMSIMLTPTPKKTMRS